MSKRSVQRKMSQMQLYPLAFNPLDHPSSWVSLKNEQSSSGKVDYLVIHKPKSQMSCKEICFNLSQHTLAWNTLVTTLIFIGYFLISTIYIYNLPKTPFNWEFYLSLACDTLYIIDLILSVCSRLSPQIDEISLEKPRSIGFILVDLVLSIPYSTIYLIVHLSTNSYLFLILRLVTLLRMYRLVLLFVHIEKSIQKHRWTIFYIKFVAYFSTMEHCFACIWYILSTVSHKKITWISILANTTSSPKSISEWYLTTSYFSVSLLTQTGFGDIYPVDMVERIIAVFTMCIGIFLWMYYVSCLIILFLRKKYPQYKIRKQLSLIQEHLRLIEAEKSILKKCTKYYEVFWTRRDGILTTNRLNDLPDVIVAHMNQKSCSFILKYSIIFNDKPASFLRNVCLYVKHEFYVPGENIYEENKPKGKMIIVKSGLISILSEEDNETPIVSLNSGTCLGEVALIVNLPSKVNVRATTYVEAYTIYAKDFSKIITSCPDFYIDIRHSIFNRIDRTVANISTSKISWRDLKRILRENENSINISKPIVTKYLSLYRMAPTSRKLKFSFKKIKFEWIRNNDTSLMLLWEIFIVTCAIIVSIFHPYFVTFHRSYPRWYENISNGIHIIYVIDIYVLLTTSIVKRGKRIDTIKGILEERMDTFSFYMDVVASFYLEVYSVLSDDEDRFYYLLKLNRILKVVRISTLSNRLENNMSKNSIKISFIKYVTYLLLFSYWFSLLLYIQTCFYPSCEYDGWFITKLKENILYRGFVTEIYGKLLISTYFGLSNSLVVGIGDISPVNTQDVVFTILVIIIGRIIFGYCIAALSSLLALKLKSRNKFEDLMTAVQFYSSKRSIPHKLEKRIRTYFNVQWEYNEAHVILAKKSLLSNLPKYLRHDILTHEKLATLRKFVIFDEMDDEFLWYLVHHSRTVVVAPNEIVTYFGSINREMYLIYKGFCLKQTENNVYETIGDGKSIGFSSLLFGLPSLNNVCTLTHCILIYITVEMFNNALHSTPNLHKTVYKTRQLILAKYQSNYEVKMIENPRYTKRKRKLKLKYRKLNEKMIKSKSFVNTYKYCVSNKESYSKLSTRAGKICLLKYLLMPIAILPYGSFLKIWYIIRLLVTIILYFAIPLEYLFSPYKNELHYSRFVLEILVYIDIYLRFHVAYYGEQNQLIIHPWKTAEHYMKGQFIVDIFIWFPYSLFIILVKSNHTEGHSQFAHSISPHFFHCSIHLIKILDIYRIILAIQYTGEKFNKFSIFRYFKYGFLTILLVHSWSMILMTLTCKYIHNEDIPSTFIANNLTKIPGMIPKPTAELNLYCIENSWLNRSHCRNYSTLFEVYSAASYFVLQTMTGTGVGDIFAESKTEIVIVILILVTGIIFYGYVITDTVSRSTRPRNSLLMYESMFLHLINYMKQEKVDKFLKSKIQNYLQYKWNRTRNVKIHSLLSKMNSTLHEDVMLLLYEGTLRQVPMFEKLDHSFFRVIGKELREEYFLEGDTVIHANDIVQDIYIVHKGSVEVSSPHNMIPVIMGIGGVFGNVFERNVSLCEVTIRATKNLDVLCLKVETFRKILKDYPFIQKQVGAFVRNETQKHYAIPNSFIDDGSVYLNPNMYWSTRRPANKKKSCFSACRDSFNPDSHDFTAFSCFLIFVAYCNCILTTYQFAFQHFCNFLLILVIIIDVIFLLKFCMEINSPYANPPGFLTSRSFFAKCMERKWRRTLDFLANLPFSYSILFVPFISNDNANFYFSIWRMLTLLRLFYMFQFFLVHKEKLMARRFFLELSIFIILSTIICHLLTCMWYLIICPWSRCSNLSWISISVTNTPMDLYVTSLYFIVNTLTCTGTGEIVPHSGIQMFAITLYMIISKILLGYFITQLIRILQCGNTWLVKYETIMEHLKSYYVNMGAQQNQINYMIRYMSKLWKKRNGLQRYDLIMELPRTLRIDLMTSIYGKLIKDSYIFCQTERDFIRQLSLQLKHRTYFPGDYIVHDGDVDSCMYFIHRGDVQILTITQTVNETIHEVLHKDEVFGIVQGLFKEIPHHFSFRALTIVDLAVLKLSEWEYLLDFFPKSKDIIYRRVEEIYYTI